MSDPPDEGAKKIVLARRARFIAAAVAGLGLACGKEKAAPCLSIAAPQQDAAPFPEPTACLSAPIPQEPSAPDAEPRPCLSIAPPVRDAGSSKKR